MIHCTEELVCIMRPTTASRIACKRFSRQRDPVLSQDLGGSLSKSFISPPFTCYNNQLQILFVFFLSHLLLNCRGFARFVNVRDDSGATPLHLAARQGRHDCVHILLENGAIVSAPTGTYGLFQQAPPPPFFFPFLISVLFA